jgi:Ca-activated chloride channel family protein
MSVALQYPWIFLIPVILLPWIWIRPRARVVGLLPSEELVVRTPPSFRQLFRTPILALLLTLIVFSLAAAAARPYRTAILPAEQQARNLMLTLDISGSMKERDFELGRAWVSRLDAVKSVVTEFIDKRLMDRIGLVVFGTEAYLQAPLTLDHTILKQHVSLLQVGIAGEGTAIGDGLGVSLKRLRDLPGKSKAIILLTDGVNNSGQVNPLQAAKVAEDLGIKIHTIGIGTRGRTQPSRSPFGNRAEFDEASLRAIAERSGGRYFYAKNLDELRAVYDEIDSLETSTRSEPPQVVIAEYSALFVTIAGALFVFYFLLHETCLRKIP